MRLLECVFFLFFICALYFLTFYHFINYSFIFRHKSFVFHAVGNTLPFLQEEKEQFLLRARKNRQRFLVLVLYVYFTLLFVS